MPPTSPLPSTPLRPVPRTADLDRRQGHWSSAAGAVVGGYHASMAKNSLQKLLEAGVQFGEMTRQQAEGAVQRLVKAGEVRRSETEKMVQTLLERGRETAAQLAATVQDEVTKQLGWLVARFDDLEGQVQSVVGRLAPGGSSGEAPAPVTAAAEKAAANTAPAKKKAAAKKAPAKKKAAAKKAPAKKKAAAKQAVGSSGVRKVATSRQR